MIHRGSAVHAAERPACPAGVRWFESSRSHAIKLKANNAIKPKAAWSHVVRDRPVVTYRSCLRTTQGGTTSLGQGHRTGQGRSFHCGRDILRCQPHPRPGDAAGPAPAGGTVGLAGFGTLWLAELRSGMDWTVGMDRQGLPGHDSAWSGRANTLGQARQDAVRVGYGSLRWGLPRFDKARRGMG